MSGPTVYLAFGSLISLVGIIFVAIHVRQHYSPRTERQMKDETEADFLARQYARRMQTSALAVTLGALIGLFGVLRPVQESPVFATVYVIVLLLLSIWLVLLALSDAVASRIHTSRQFRSNERAQRSLQQALADVRKAYGMEN
ncbi:MAG: hypothetical protein KDA81_06980 [Planctomycetaceae bacterium]|nr:hypothetical protein [Planctomycetaceae bacterium]